MDAYVTLIGEGTSLYVDRKSEFLGYAAHVTTEEEAIAFVSTIRKKHSDARHNVYAYMLKEGNITRYSDDGEPQGTAGIPVLDIIRKIGFTDAVIVVTRYFGGILLGTGGLVRAYTAAARDAVRDAGVAVYEDFDILEFTTDYSFYQRVAGILSKHSAIEESAEFTDAVTVRASVRASSSSTLADALFSASSGRVTALVTESCKRPGELLDI